MDWIETLDDLHALYGTPTPAALAKVTPRLTPAYRTWIEGLRFCVLTTVGPEGTDGSPRGDEGAVVQVADDRTLLMPDWKGNERIDSLRNILRDGRVSLLFLIPGSVNAMRVNGTARLTADPALLARFERQGRHPRTVIVIAVAEVYAQCSRAVQRSALWTAGDRSAGLPTFGDMLRDATGGGIDGAAYDAGRATRMGATMW
jgi:hypothetical protein